MNGLDNKSFVRVSPVTTEYSVEQAANGTSCCSAPLLRSLLRAIAQDNVELLRTIMNGLDHVCPGRSMSCMMTILNGKDILMSTPATENASVWLCNSLVTQLKVRNPLSTAVVYQALDCFKEMVTMGADLFAVDIRGNNILHLIVYSYQDHKSDVPLQMYDFILGKLKTGEERRSLLYCESDDGLRPLDLSAKLCCPRLFNAFLYTEGAYRQIVSQTGKVVTNRFILPSRNCDTERKSASFLWHLVWMEDTSEGMTTIEEITSIPVIQKLIQARRYMILWYLVLWAMLRTLQGVLFLAVDAQADEIYYNLTCTRAGPVPHETLSEYLVQNGGHIDSPWLPLATVQMVYGIIFGIITLVTDSADVITRWREGKTLGAGLMSKMMKGRLENSPFYRVSMILLAIHFLAGAACYIVDPEGADNDFMGIIFLNVRVLITFSIFYFLQLAPFVGTFVIGFQKMLAALAKFAGLQIGAMYLFSTLFRHVRMYFCKFGTSSCYMTDSLYTTFLTMLNMAEIVPVGKCDAVGESLLKILHVLYVFIVAVLTINYLIAIMSTVYSYFSDQMSSVVEIHRICNILVIERRLRILSSIFYCLKKKKDNTKCTAEVIDVEEIDREQQCMTNLRLGEGPFGDYSTFGTNVDEVYTV